MVNSGEVNGIPGHANKHLLTDVLKEDWGFAGFSVSDWEDFINLSAINAENLKITSLLGGVVFEKDKLEEKTIDVRHLPAGVYNCSYYSENIYRSEKLLLIK
jgi:hypothetical protein